MMPSVFDMAMLGRTPLQISELIVDSRVIRSNVEN